MNRRFFFKLLSGACAALGLPLKAAKPQAILHKKWQIIAGPDRNSWNTPTAMYAWFSGEKQVSPTFHQLQDALWFEDNFEFKDLAILREKGEVELFPPSEPDQYPPKVYYDKAMIPIREGAVDAPFSPEVVEQFKQRQRESESLRRIKWERREAPFGTWADKLAKG